MPATEEVVQTKGTATDEPSDELIRDLQSGKKKMDELQPELRVKTMRKLSAEPEEVPAAKEPPKAEEKKSEAKTDEKMADEPKETTAGLKARIEAAKAEQKRLADEANSAEQKAKAAKERRDKAKAALEEATKVEVKLPEELLSEESQASLLKRLAAVEKQNEALRKIVLEKDEDDVKAFETQHQSAAEALQFSEIDEVQAEFPSLRTEIPFAQANAQYGAWLNEIQAACGLKEKIPNIDPITLRNKAVEMWNADPEFQKKIANHPPKDVDKLMTLLTVYNRTQEKGGTVMGNLLEHLKKTGVLPDMVQRVAQGAAADAANRTAKALAKDEISPISPGDGTTKGYATSGDWTVAKAKQVIQTVNQKQSRAGLATPEERQQVQEAMAYLNSVA